MTSRKDIQRSRSRLKRELRQGMGDVGSDYYHKKKVFESRRDRCQGLENLVFLRQNRDFINTYADTINK